jgi:hypothetical protein
VNPASDDREAFGLDEKDLLVRVVEEIEVVRVMVDEEVVRDRIKEQPLGRSTS